MAENNNSDGYRVLVVDDEQIVLNLVEDTLSDEGYEVMTTPSPLEAIELVKQHHFDFILTDIRMPEINGIELVKKIHEITPTIGVIFMTGYANLDTAKQAIKEGAYDYIMKPFELSEIRQAMARALDQKKTATKATLSAELTKIADLSNMMYASGELASLLRLSLSFAIVQNAAEAGIAVFHDHINEELCLIEVGRLSSGSENVERIKFPVDDWRAIPVATEPAILSNEKLHPLYNTPAFNDHHEMFLPGKYYDSRAAVLVPMHRNEQMLGFICLFYDSADHELKSSDTQFLKFVSSQLTISLENLQLLEDSREAYRRLEYLQDQAIQMEKMATRGQMSAEIGHELNNYLGVVVANFQLMNLRIRKGVTEGLERFTDSIQDHLDKISRFTKGLMDYSSMSQTKFVRLDINRMLESIVEFLQPQKRFRQFEIEYIPEDEVLEAEVDQGLIEQVLYNLLNNAADASQDSPKKRIEVRARKLSQETLMLAVRDFGSGISEEGLCKLFKERFTTKEMGHGIGLTVTKNIVDRHGGSITAKSKIGEGTEFIIELPVYHEMTEKTSAPAAAS